MKAIILAGGLGTRLGKYTENMPKCMLEVMGKSLLERQVDAYRRCGIDDIVVVRKHLAEKIAISGVKYIDETDYSTHMVVGLYCARSEFNDDFILSYADLLFEDKVLKKAIASEADIGVVVDDAWKDYWIARHGSYLEDSESLMIGKDDNIVSLGVSNPKPEEMDARYLGMIKFSKRSFPMMDEVYAKAKSESWEKPWYTSKSFKKAYMTDFLQALIDHGVQVKAERIQNGWLEFDTAHDYEFVLDLAKRGELDRFCKVRID